MKIFQLSNETYLHVQRLQTKQIYLREPEIVQMLKKAIELMTNCAETF